MTATCNDQRQSRKPLQKRSRPQLTPPIAALVEELADKMGETATARARASLLLAADTGRMAAEIVGFFETKRAGNAGMKSG